MTIEAQQALHRNAAHVHDLALKYLSVYYVFTPFDDGSGSTFTPNTHTPQCTNLRRLFVLQYKEPQRSSDGSWVLERSLYSPNSPAFNGAWRH